MTWHIKFSLPAAARPPSIALCILAVLHLLGAATAFAKSSASESETLAPTLYVWATTGYSIYKSTMVQSNDTSTTTSYGFGLYGGADHDLGMLVARETSKFSFKLNGSSLAVDWQDVHFRYRLGPLHAGVLLSSTTWQAKAPPDTQGNGILDPQATAVDLLSIVGTGYGANVGLVIPVGRRSSLWIEASSVNIGFVQSKAFDPGTVNNAAALNARKVTLGGRTDIDLGGSLALSRSAFDAIGGFKMRSYKIAIDGTSYSEQLNTTYLGIRANMGF